MVEMKGRSGLESFGWALPFALVLLAGAPAKAGTPGDPVPGASGGDPASPDRAVGPPGGLADIERSIKEAEELLSTKVEPGPACGCLFCVGQVVRRTVQDERGPGFG